VRQGPGPSPGPEAADLRTVSTEQEDMRHVDMSCVCPAARRPSPPPRPLGSVLRIPFGFWGMSST